MKTNNENKKEQSNAGPLFICEACSKAGANKDLAFFQHLNCHEFKQLVSQLHNWWAQAHDDAGIETRMVLHQELKPHISPNELITRYWRLDFDNEHDQGLDEETAACYSDAWDAFTGYLDEYNENSDFCFGVQAMGPDLYIQETGDKETTFDPGTKILAITLFD